MRSARESGETLESSATRGPLEFVPGRRRLLPALEQVIASLRVGEEVSGELEAARAFGDESVLPTMEISRAEFTDGGAPEPGKKYEAKTADGNAVAFRVLSATIASCTCACCTRSRMPIWNFASS